VAFFQKSSTVSREGFTVRYPYHYAAHTSGVSLPRQTFHGATHVPPSTMMVLSANHECFFTGRECNPHCHIFSVTIRPNGVVCFTSLTSPSRI
jgi:hypothetical protein